MTWFGRVLLLGALAVGVAALGAHAAGTTPSFPRVVTSWPEAPGSFAEGMTADTHGVLYVTRTVWGATVDTATIERIAPDGTHTAVFGPYETPGLLAGLAWDHGQLYVANATFGDGNGVARVNPDGTLTTVLALPPEAFPNGLAFHDGWLYVTDAYGAVWRVQPGGPMPTEPWFAGPEIAPVSALGPDGIAFRGDTLYVTSYDQGLIVTLGVLPDGTAGPAHVFASSKWLVSADGIAFDPAGTLWVAVNSPGHGRLVTVSPAGAVDVRTTDTAWLDYPTQPVFAHGQLYVENGSYKHGLPNVIVFG
jgi:sugar lactone lactonase YvrE